MPIWKDASKFYLTCNVAKRDILKILGLAMGVFLGLPWNLASAQQVNGKSRPHVLLILVDDMGYGDIGAFNSASRIPTPHLNRLAGDGMRFTDAHAPGAVCHPSRYGLITGRYPFRTDVSVWPEKPVIDSGRVTVAAFLKSQGYRTAMVGKWHLGFDESQAVAATGGQISGNSNNSAAYRVYRTGQRLPGGPVDRGFESFFGIRASTDIPPYFFIRDDRVEAPPTNTISDSSSDGWTAIQGAFWRKGGIAPGMDLADVLPQFSREAARIIHEHGYKTPDTPLFLYVALPAPHTPWLPAAKYNGTSGAGDYGDFVVMVDAEIGKILSALQHAGMAEETLVIFASDNGPVWYPHDVDRFGHNAGAGLRMDTDGKTANVSFRGMKGDAYEGGHHMPFIVRWPSRVAPGTITGQTISFTDVMATLADLLDKDLPACAGEDSFSLLPVLFGKQPEDTAIRPAVVSVSARGVKSIQNREWKLIETLGSGGFTRPATVEPVVDGPRGQLYHLRNDPEEQVNVWLEHPEVVNGMTKLLRVWEQQETSRATTTGLN